MTDAAWSADDRRLVTCSAGGAVYVWDVSAGARIASLEYVDKSCVYAAACPLGRAAGAVLARTADGRLQQLVDGGLARQVEGLGRDFAPIAEAAGGRTVLAATGRGTVVTLAWPGGGDGGDAWPAGGGAGRGVGIPPGSSSHRAHDEATAISAEAAAADGDQRQALAAAPREARLHSGRVAAMALLPGLGVLFTASSDGSILMSRVALVAGGARLEPPPIWTPAALAAASAAGGGPGSATAAGGPPGLPPPELKLMTEPAVAGLQERCDEAAAALRAQARDTQYQVLMATQALREQAAAAEAELAGCRDELGRALRRLQAHLESAEEREQQVSGAFVYTYAGRATDELECGYLSDV